MSTIDSAAASSTLSLTEPGVVLFKTRDKDTIPSTVTLAGSSNLELILFDVTATGTVKAAVPGTLILTLFGASKANASADIGDWLPLSSSVPEPIGGETDLPETMWMIQGTDLMIFAGSGKMQGLFKSNVASNPQGPIDLEQHPGDITEADPLYVFAVGAEFAADAGAGDGSELCSLDMKNLVISG